MMHLWISPSVFSSWPFSFTLTDNLFFNIFRWEKQHFTTFAPLVVTFSFFICGVVKKSQSETPLDLLPWTHSYLLMTTNSSNTGRIMKRIHVISIITHWEFIKFGKNVLPKTKNAVSAVSKSFKRTPESEAPFSFNDWNSVFITLFILN